MSEKKGLLLVQTKNGRTKGLRRFKLSAMQGQWYMQFLRNRKRL
jgi:hypothetical protein